MPVDFSNSDDLPGSNPAESIFGTTPIYERAARRKRGWLKSSAAPRAATTTTSPEFTPSRPSSSRSSGGVPTWALVALPAAIVLGGGAYVLMQPRDPAEPAPMTVAAMDSATPQSPEATPPLLELEPTPEATATSRAPAAASTPPARAERAPEPTRVARTRPAPRAPAADEAGSDASAVAPNALTPRPAAAQPNPLAVNPAPLVVPSVTEPPTTTDTAPPTAPAEMGGTTQEVIPDATAVPQ
jgi:hypothetical protein